MLVYSISKQTLFASNHENKVKDHMFLYSFEECILLQENNIK